MNETERHFHLDMLAGAERLKREIGYNPTRFHQMIANYGGVGAAKALLTGADYSDGFTKLWEHKRLDVSVEAFVLLPWYEGLFSNEEKEAARRRLTLHGFDVDGFLRLQAAAPPSWTSSSGG